MKKHVRQPLLTVGFILMSMLAPAHGIETISSIDKSKQDYNFSFSISGKDFQMKQSFVPVTGAMRPGNKEWANAKIFLNATSYETNIAFSGRNMTMNFPIKIPNKVGMYPIVDYGKSPSPDAQVHIYGSIRDLGSYRATDGQLQITRIAKDAQGNSVLEGQFVSDLTVSNKGTFHMTGKFKIVDYANKMCCK